MIVAHWTRGNITPTLVKVGNEVDAQRRVNNLLSRSEVVKVEVYGLKREWHKTENWNLKSAVELA